MTGSIYEGNATYIPTDEYVRATKTLTGRIDISAGGVVVDEFASQETLIATASSMLYDLTSAVTSGSNATKTPDFTVTRWTGNTLKVTPTAAAAQVTKGSLALSLDPIDQLLSLDLYVPSLFLGSANVQISLYNSSGYTANFHTWSFNLNAIRQGWNTLKMWCGDTDGAVGTGTLGLGCTKTKGGTGFDGTLPIGYFEINLNNLSGVDILLDGFRKGCKSKTALVMGFDATGYSAADTVMTKKDGVAEVFKAAGIRGYFTATYIYDLMFPTAADTLRKEVLYRAYEWDALPHFYNHGGSQPGGSRAVTSLTRATNVVTGTTTAAHGFVVGTKFWQVISGATPSEYNGLMQCTITGATTFTYTAAGGDGSATGTLFASTLTQDVIATDTATTRAILRHELVDLVRLMKSKRWGRALHIGAYPNNSVGVMEVTQPICAEAGIKYFRSIKKRTTAVTEFGVDNPLHFGSMEMGSGATATTLADLKNALLGAIGRGEHLWTYGHYVLDETDPANAAHAGANLEYAPGQGGNPAPPAVSDGGWWYLGTLKRFINEAVLPAIAAGTVIPLRPSEWAEMLGNLDGSH